MTLLVFLLVAFGGAWLAAMPLWLSGEGLASPFVTVLALAMMFTPSVAVLAAWSAGRGRDGRGLRALARQTGLGLGRRRVATLWLCAAMWIGVPLLCVLAVAVSAAAGVLSTDLAGLSYFRSTMEEATGGPVPIDPRTLALIQVGAILPGALINTIPALGEEWGWRGWLLPRLLPLGTVRAVIVSGVIWGIWHAPLTLLGHNYPNLGPWAAAMFVPFCVLFGGLLAWVRLRSGSVWPAAVGHGAVNAAAGVTMVVGDADAPPNFALAGITGLAGLALLAVLVPLLFRIIPVSAAATPVESAPPGNPNE